MGRHSDLEQEEDPRTLTLEPSANHLPVLIVVGMLCVTAIITVLAVAGAAEVLGQIASAVFLSWAGVTIYRLKQGPKS
jgi:hypothetical protein